MTGLGAAMAGGNPRRGRMKNDDYPSPRDLTQALLDNWQPRSQTVWEPACGNGAMARVIEEAGYDVIASDLVDRGYGQGGVDFLTTTERAADCLITNPPFGDMPNQFIRHAFDLGVKEMALVLKSTFWHAKDRDSVWRDHQPSMILALTWRPDFRNLGGPTMEIIWTIFGSEPVTDTIYRRVARPIVAKQGRLGI